ncbi:unnamed protein product [Rotaria sp. Silwood1]|nr:unnamed protein product [Rotaria sp. Silwood1]
MATSTNENILSRIDLIDSYFSKHTLTTVEQFDQELNDNNNCCNDKCCSCFNYWWNVKFNHQRFIVHIVEKTTFHIAIIILVLLDCLLVVGELLLDFIYLNEKCEHKNTKNITNNEEVTNHKLELAIEILHYASIALLAIFVFEVITKIYAFGKKWWDFRTKKMEWLDAIVVIASFVIDIYFLKKPSVIGEISLLFISFRLWRIIRIINSVAQSIRSQDETAKKNLANTYIQVIELLLSVSTRKTEAASELRNELTRENFDKTIEKFTSLDQSCRTILAHCQKPSSRNAITDIAQTLQEALEHIRLTSSTLGITNKKK